MVLKYTNIKFLLVIFVFNVILISNDYISIPFKKCHASMNIPTPYDKFIKDYLNNNIYMNLLISEPKQNISAKINTLEFELIMKNVYKLPFENLNSYFSRETSSTFKIISEKADKHFPNSKYVKDLFNFCINYDINKKECSYYKKYENINFLYSEEDEVQGEEKLPQLNETKNTYFEIGLNFKSFYNFDKNKYSLLTNLVANKFITNNNWFIHFNDEEKDNNEKESNNKNDEGVLVFGIDPIEFFGNKYNKENIFSCQGINKNYDYKNNWSIIFNELKQKTLKPDNKDIIIEKNFQGVINFNYDVIVGNNHYMEIITNTFFLPYITKDICQKKLANNKFYYFSCKSISLSFNEIKENFPILYFKQNEFDFIFELRHHDLFIQIGDQIFFLIVFNKNNPTSSFLLGNVFLKKYFFSFDYNSQKIMFYKNIKTKNNGKEIYEPNDLLWYNSTKIIVFLIFFIFVVGIIGFYFGKRFYKKRKLIANELEDQFEYKSPLNKKNDFEMKFKF